MEFVWDERKRRANLQRHGIDFTDVVEVFEGPTLARMDTRFDYGEDRWIAVRMSHGRVLVVAYRAQRGADDSNHFSTTSIVT